MKQKSLLAILIAIVLMGATGCSLFSKNAENIAKGLLEEKYGNNKIKSMNVEQKSADHLRGLVTFQPLPEDLKNGRGGEGAIFLATKVNGEWKLVFDGNGAISCEEMKTYNFPSKMIEDCFSEENNNENSNIEAEGKMAEEALNKFFAYLSDKEYEKAVSLLMVSDEDWNEMANYTEEKDKGDKTKVLQNYCDGVKTCLNSKVLKAEKEEAGYYKLTVQFIEDDGKVFVLPPCCGATEKEMPSQTDFPFGVRKIDDTWKVARVPLYRP